MRFLSLCLFSSFQLAILFCSMPLSAASTLSARLLEAASNTSSAEQIVNELQGRAQSELTVEDYLVMAEGYQTLGNREAALDAVQKAEVNANTPYMLALSLYSKAQIYGIFYQNAEMAIQQLIQAEQQLSSLNEPTARILLNDVLNSFASAYNLQGDLKTAQLYAQRSLALAKEINSDSRELNALILNGRIALQNNQYQLAFAYLQQGLTLATRLKDEEQLASIHFRFGMAHRKLDQHLDALEHFSAAAERYLQLDRMTNYSAVLVYMAESYLEEPRQIDKADTLLQQALSIAEKQQNMSRTATAYYSLGRVAMLRKEYSESEEYYQKALQHFRQINSRGMVIETSLALVQLMIEQQRYSEASAIKRELTDDIDSAATFLQLRYFTSAARLAAAAADWQTAYELQEKVTELNRQELAGQIQHNMLELKAGLNQVSDAEQQDSFAVELQQALATAESRQVMLQAVLVLMIFITFIFWQLYRHKPSSALATPAPETAPRQWSQFQEKAKAVAVQQPVTLLVILPRFRAALQRQFGRRIVAELLQGIEQELNSSAVKASYSGTEMLWLAVSAETAEEPKLCLQAAISSFQQKLTALGVEPAILAVELPLKELLGNTWHKDDLNALTEAIWFGWALAEAQPTTEPLWQLTFSALHPRPCEWQVEDLRSDMLNACRLGELVLYLNDQALEVAS
ncbi:hypothetical protein GCM10010919_05530 [Alishewanella longhuensis]|uniref:Tetratricopeptide repeat protein n=1 Tax=Alishewanella longhuensis TaxID=1091037 RepID=A0ABQ3KX29_9ALTE|nr:histidine kinase [Alishewanella longhuensis]GHG61279.1 hypothetical protein GCM10010919_05530 [Alishewanella longhuensis]